jgi:hypothetical protein
MIPELIPLEQFVEYFKTLNELPENEKGQEIDFDSVDRENVHNILNSPITEEEILRVFKNKLFQCYIITNIRFFFLSILFNIFQRPFGSVLDFSLIIFAVLS